MIKKVIEFDCEKGTEKRQRPEFLSTKKYAVSNIKKLIDNIPMKELKVITI